VVSLWREVIMRSSCRIVTNTMGHSTETLAMRPFVIGEPFITFNTTQRHLATRFKRRYTTYLLCPSFYFPSPWVNVKTVMTLAVCNHIGEVNHNSLQHICRLCLQRPTLLTSRCDVSNHSLVCQLCSSLLKCSSLPVAKPMFHFVVIVRCALHESATKV
jgi:hypothetical protein